jgi:vancomycin resistance protein YoaR
MRMSTSDQRSATPAIAARRPGERLPLLLALGAGVALVGGAGVALRTRGGPPPVAVASYSTSLAGRTRNQAANIRLGAQRLDGVVLRPGAVFSFARTLGPVSAETGFVKGLAIRGGEPASEDGGGICQLASTIYNAALRADLRIVERRKHLWPVRSVPPGLDATFASGHADLRFQNTSAQTLRLQVTCDAHHLSARLLGERPLPTPVEVVRAVKAVLPPGRVVRTTALLRRGQQRVASRGRPGFEVEVWRAVGSGPALRRERVSADRYAPVNEVVLVGTGR